jgi:NAD(P)-dependent dehydrogenase (short-subunit alcohol dehydrogenase family)
MAGTTGTSGAAGTGSSGTSGSSGTDTADGAGLAGPGSGLLRGRTAVVTGGARGIGLTVARRYAAEGATVVLADIDAAAAASAAEEVTAQSSRPALGLGVDVTDEDSVAALVDQVRERVGRVDVLVANAGILLQAPAVDTEVRAWRRLLDVNLTGAFVTCRAFGRLLIEQGAGGRVILSSSLFGLRGGRENAAYSASKFGMVGLAQCLAAEWAPHGITVNSVCPGQVATDMMRQLFTDRARLRGTTEAAVEAEMLAKIPMGRLADPAEIADVYVFLASDLSRYVTAQALVADGGWQVG